MPAPHPFLLDALQGSALPPRFRVTMPLVGSAIEHGVAPLLDQAVRDRGLDGDHDALVRLAMRSLDSAAQNQAATRALGVLLEACASRGIGIAVFKGLAIGHRWYPRPELRPAADIDIFINPDQIHRLPELVAAYAPNPASRAVVRSMVGEGRVFEYLIHVEGVAVDVHIDPMNLVLPSRQMDVIWRRRHAFEIGDGVPITTLDLELSLLQSLLHLFRDNFADLLHIYDVALMLDSKPDWAFVQSFADTEGWTDIIRFSLGVVCDVLERPSPLPSELGVANRVLVSLIWPDRVRARGNESVVTSARRQSLVSLLIDGRRRELAQATARRMLPPRAVINDRHEYSGDPYALALYRWRRSQRSQIKAMRRFAPAGEIRSAALDRARDHFWGGP